MRLSSKPWRYQPVMHGEAVEGGALCRRRTHYLTKDRAAIECVDCQHIRDGVDRPSIAAKKAYDASRPAATRPAGAHVWRPHPHIERCFICRTCDRVSLPCPPGGASFVHLQREQPCAGRAQTGGACEKA